MLAKLRARLSAAWAALCGCTSADDSRPTSAVAPQSAIPWAKIEALLAADDNPWIKPPPQPTRLKLPDVMPGVRPEHPPTGDELVLAMDGPYQEPLAFDGAEPAAWGFAGAGFLGPGLAFLGFPYLAELEQITEYRTPAETLSNELTRTWGKPASKDKKKDLGNKLSEITTRMTDLGVRDKFREGALKTEQFGRAHLAINIKNEDDDRSRQLPLTTIKPGTLLGFQIIEPYWMTPFSWNSTRPRQPDFYKPQSWYELGRKTHASRYCTFIFREVPDLLKPAYDFAGISITQLMLPYVQRWLRTAKNVNDLINVFSVVTLATDMQSYLQNPAEFVKRHQFFTQNRDNRGMMVINQGTEELSMQNVPLGSLDKLQAQAQEHMATPARMPLIKFFGVVPTGLNATSEGEFQAWYDYVKGIRELGFGKHIERVLELVQMDLYGEIDPDIVWEWDSLYESTPKEDSELQKADADRDALYLDKGVVGPDEVRDKLKRNPKSGYDNLEGDAPEPPELTEFDLTEQSAENAHERSEEAAGNAHERSEESAEEAHARGRADAERDAQLAAKKGAKDAGIKKDAGMRFNFRK